MMQPIVLSPDFGLYVLRLALGVVFLTHGWGKLMNNASVAKAMGWSVFKVMGLGLFEVISALMLIIGFRVQMASVILSVILIAAIYKHVYVWKTPFIVANRKAGYEFEMVLLAGCIAVLMTGGGSLTFLNSLVNLARGV